MRLSLSVRIVEAACKTKLHLPLSALVSIAAEAGYEAICMRASAAGVQTPIAEIREHAETIRNAGLSVSMVTADFDVPLNNDRGPCSLRDIDASLAVAEALDCRLVRVCMKRSQDIPHARIAADRAADRNIRLVHQCHTTSLFEELQPMLNVLEQIDRSNFGLIYEPANLMLCGQPYGEEALALLRPHLMNVYVQNHRLDPEGPNALGTYCRGEVRFHHLPIWEKGGVDFDAVFRGLNEVPPAGHFTIHQAEGIETFDDARAYAFRCAEFVRSRLEHQ